MGGLEEFETLRPCLEAVRDGAIAWSTPAEIATMVREMITSYANV